MKALESTPIERALKRICVLPSTGCWLWTGPVNHNGYGVIANWNPKWTRATHRFFFEEMRGPIPDGLELDHLCRTRGCCNPGHLEMVTKQENMRRMRKSHCVKGHELIDYPNQKRRACRTCCREKMRARYVPRKQVQ